MRRNVQFLCSQVGCNHIGIYHYVWPGLGKRVACRKHKETLEKIAVVVQWPVEMMSQETLQDVKPGRSEKNPGSLTLNRRICS